MGIETPNRMHATPRRTTRPLSAGEVERTLRAKFRPAEQAHADALRNDDPHALASRYCTSVLHECANERANIRMDALCILSANKDAAGALVVTVTPAEVSSIPELARTDLETLTVKREKENDKWIGVWQHGRTKLLGWLNRTGGELQHNPFPSLGVTIAWTALPAAFEVWAVMSLMDSQAVAGEVTPFVRGLLFAVVSVAFGMLGAFGASLAADKRGLPRGAGILLIVLALAGWCGENVLAAHMRAAIEAGTVGNADDILGTFDRGFWWPFVTPVAIIIVATSAFTTAAAWAKWLAFFGSPFGARGTHAKFRWAQAELDNAETTHKAAITTTATGHTEQVGELVKMAWVPANAGQAMAEDSSLTLAQADECFGAVDRIAQALVAEYATTFRRLRPGVDVSRAVELPGSEHEKLGDPQAIFDRVELVTRAAMAVEGAAGESTTELRNLEVEFLHRVEARFSATRNGTGNGGLVALR